MRTTLSFTSCWPPSSPRESRYTEALSQLAKIPAPGPLTPSSTAAEKAAHSTYVRAANRRVDLHLDWGRADLAVEAAVSARQVLDPRMRTDHVRLLRSALRAQLAGQDPVGARETLVVLQRFGVGIDEEIDILFAEENSTDGIAALKEACLAAPDRMTLLRRYAIELLRFEGIETALATVQNAEHRLNALLDRRKRGLDASGEYAVTGRTALLHSDLDAIRAALHQEAGDVTAAVASLRDALAHRGRDPYTLNHLAYLFAEEGIELPEAESLILRALEQQPFSGVMQDTYGWVLYRSGRHEEALVALEVAVRYAPREPEILAHLGEVLARLGQRDAAPGSIRRGAGGGQADRAGSPEGGDVRGRGATRAGRAGAGESPRAGRREAPLTSGPGGDRPAPCSYPKTGLRPRASGR